MKKRILGWCLLLAAAFLLATSPPASAATIALWNYNLQTADNGGTVTGTENPTPVIAGGSGSGTQASVGSVTFGYNAGNYPDNTPPYAGDYGTDSAEGAADIRYRFGTNAANEGLRWNVSTEGYQDIQVQLGIFSQTNFTSRTWSLEYSPNNGTNWYDLTTVNYTGGSTWLTVSYDLSSITAVNNNANFAFRFISDQATSTTLTADYVNVTGNAVPIPAAVWLLGSGLVGLVIIRRRRNK
jgi:hypothetical protein